MTSQNSDTIISEADVNLAFTHPLRQLSLSTEDLKAKLQKANNISFSAGFLRLLKFKLPEVSVEECTAEYRRFLFMISCSS